MRSFFEFLEERDPDMLANARELSPPTEIDIPKRYSKGRFGKNFRGATERLGRRAPSYYQKKFGGVDLSLPNDSEDMTAAIMQQPDKERQDQKQ